MVERIVVVCGLGASSSFAAQRVRSAVKDAGHEAVVTPCALSDLESALVDAHFVLVAPHLVGEMDHIRRAASRYGTTVAVLPNSVLRGRNDHDILPLIGIELPESSQDDSSPEGPFLARPG